MSTDVRPLAESARLVDEVLDRVGQAVVGKRQPLRLVLAGILARGHVLLEDVPGVGKTLTARSFAQALGLGFRRVQFTPDLLPSDVTGSYVYDQRSSEFVFRAGPIFTGLLLADEINRTPPKTQAALLEAMQERQVTVEGTTFPLAEPFHVLATANPVEYEGTYPLPEAQLDRFLLRVGFGYPTADEEWDVLTRRIDRRREEQSDRAGDGRRRAVRAAAGVRGRDRRSHRRALLRASWPRRPGDHRQVLIGASPRGSLALLLTARAHALIEGRDFVLPEDVKAVGIAALAHRITVRPELWLHDVDGTSVVARRARLGAHTADGAAGRRRVSADRPPPGSWVPTPAHLRAVAAAVRRARGRRRRPPAPTSPCSPCRSSARAAWGTLHRPSGPTTATLRRRRPGDVRGPGRRRPR